MSDIDKKPTSVVQPPNTTGNELDEIIEKVYSWGYDSGINQASDWAGSLDFNDAEHMKSESAKSKLTKYIEQQVLIGRIDELKNLDKLRGEYLGDLSQASIDDQITTLKAQLEEWKK